MSWIFGTYEDWGHYFDLNQFEERWSGHGYLEYGEEGEAELTAFDCDIGEIKEVNLQDRNLTQEKPRKIVLDNSIA